MTEPEQATGATTLTWWKILLWLALVVVVLLAARAYGNGRYDDGLTDGCYVVRAQNTFNSLFCDFLPERYDELPKLPVGER